METDLIKPIVDYIKNNGIVLDKPIVFFDLETTGLDTMKDRIIEIDAIKINPDYTTDELYHLINPEMHIPDEASGVNDITDDDVRDKPTFAQVVDEIDAFFGSSKNRYDIGGFNITHFDIPVLVEEFKRVGKSFRYGGRKIIDAYRILVKAEPRDLKNVYKSFTGAELQGAHTAHADTTASALIAFNQLSKYNFNSLEEMSKFTNEDMIDAAGFFKRNKDGVIVFAIGKYKGQPVLDVYNEAVKSGDNSYFEKYIKVKCGSDINNHLELIINGREK